MNASNPIGRVVSLNAGGDDSQVMVEVEAGVMCERCAAGKGCGAGLLGASPQSKLVAAIVGTEVGISCGDRVSLELRPVNVLRGAAIVYGLPLSGAVIAAVLSTAVGFGDAGSVLAVVVGSLSGFLVAKLRVSSEVCLKDFTPVITERLADSANGY